MRLLLILALVVAAQSPLAARPAGERPNVILIMADDVGWEAFGCYGAEDYRTPRIDALAAKGIQFRHCYSTPLCTPSRVQLMTGKYNYRNYTHFGYLDPKERTFGHLMQEAGYKTAIAGKWQLNGIYNRMPGHDNMERPREAGFDEYCLWQLTREKSSPGGGERFWSPAIEQNGKFLSPTETAGQYGPDLFCDFLCEFLEEHQEEPVFLYYPMVLVHDPFVPTPDTIGDRPRDQSANKAPRGSKAKKENFVAMVHYMDKIVGRIVDRVEALGLTENTVILFTADNGTHPSITSTWNGREVQGGKGGMTDTGTHVPLIASWPGKVPAGTVVDDLVDFTDFYPTLAAVAGADVSEREDLDGINLLPRLKGDPGTPRDWVLCHYQPYWNKEPGQFVRTAEYKLYRDGGFFQVPSDLEEKNPLVRDSLGESGLAAYNALSDLIDRLPPAPVEKAGKDTESRPTFPEWPRLTPPLP